MSGCPVADNPAQQSPTAGGSIPKVDGPVAAMDPAAHLELDDMDELQLLDVVAAEGHGPFLMTTTPHF
jgi:hypothetical protein